MHTRRLIKEISIENPDHTRLRQSRCENSVGELQINTVAATEVADNKVAKAKKVAVGACIRTVDRSPPFSVTLNGRPKGLRTAWQSAIVIGSAVIACVTSVKSGSVRPAEIHDE